MLRALVGCPMNSTTCSSIRPSIQPWFDGSLHCLSYGLSPFHSIAQNADGVYEGIAIGGDRYPGTTFIDHLLRYEANPDVKMLVVLGEVGGVEEYKIVEAIKDGRLKKKIVAWCIGTCSKIFPYEVQFGHAGACASGQLDTADAKNLALREAG